MNPLFFPVVALAALLFVAGYKAGMRPTGAGWLQYAVAAACALPATLLAVYYLHLFDDAVWFYRFRSLPWSELSAAGAGLLAGLLYASSARKGLGLRVVIPAFLLMGLFVPYVKPLVAPLDASRLTGTCVNGVCLQSTPSTCGPSSVASILRLFNGVSCCPVAPATSILGETDSAYIIGDPMVGRLDVPKWRLARAYDFTGFFMIVGKPKT